AQAERNNGIMELYGRGRLWFSAPKGRDSIAQAVGLGFGGRGLPPRAAPWAIESRPFGAEDSHLELPRLTVRPAEQRIRVILAELVRLRVPRQLLAQPQGDGADVTHDHRAGPDRGVADWLLAGLHAVEEVLHVPARHRQPLRVRP